MPLMGCPALVLMLDLQLPQLWKQQQQLYAPVLTAVHVSFLPAGHASVLPAVHLSCMPGGRASVLMAEHLDYLPVEVAAS
jgi:hypothetical protein